MRFLEQHFYIDAGISLSRGKIDTEEQDICKGVQHKLSISKPESSLEAMSEQEIKKLVTLTTNITDDVKVDLKRRNKKIIAPKRHSIVFPYNIETEINKKILNRRSLNIVVGNDPNSKIPVCIKKSKSNIDVKAEDVKATKLIKSESDIKNNNDIKGKMKGRPKSEIIKCNNYKWVSEDKQKMRFDDDSIKSNVPNQSSFTESTTKLSSLPVPKR